MTNRDDHLASALTIARLKTAKEVLWILLLVLTPLAVNFWGSQPFELPKVLLLRTLVWFIAGLTLGEYYLENWSIRDQLKANRLAVPVGLLALVILVTTAAAANRHISFWGSLERGQGGLTLLTYCLLFFLAVHTCRSISRLRRLLKIMTISSVPLIIIALLQFLGWQPLNLVSDARSPLFVTFGRSNFLAAYLAILLPTTMAILAINKSGRRWFWAALLAGQMLIIFLTAARASWIAAAVALAAFTLAYWGRQLSKSWRISAAAATGALIISGPIFVLWQGPSQTGSAAARASIWRAAMQLISRQPLLGYGPDSLGFTFHSVYPQGLVYDQGRQFFIDRAHNFLLDWTVSTGLPGLLSYLLILLLFAMLMIGALRRSPPLEKRALISAVLAGVLANTTNNMLSFDVTATGLATWFLIGAGTALVSPQFAVQGGTSPNRPRMGQLRVAAILTAIVAVIWSANGRPLLADISARSAHLYGLEGSNSQSIAAAQKAVGSWPDEPAYHLLLSQAYARQAASSDRQSVPFWFTRAEDALEEARRLRPQDPQLWLHTAQLYREGHRRFGLNNPQSAQRAYQQALSLAPNQAIIYFLWGQAALQDNDARLAAQLLRQAIELDSSSGHAFLYLAAAEQTLGRVEDARGSYREAQRLLAQENSSAKAQEISPRPSAFFRLFKAPFIGRPDPNSLTKQTK